VDRSGTGEGLDTIARKATAQASRRYMRKGGGG
jgi:hypothetical protein